MPEPIVIVNYDPAWPDVFAALAAPVAAVLGPLALAIEHVGSTSVPGLSAKPIIDFDVVIATRTDLDAAISALASIGYAHRGDLDVPGREAFEQPTGLQRHHLYVCAADNAELRRHLAFRDYLRTHAAVAHVYEDVKRAAALRFRDNREAYNDAKSEVVREVLALALTTEATR